MRCRSKEERELSQVLFTARLSYARAAGEAHEALSVPGSIARVGESRAIQNFVRIRHWVTGRRRLLAAALFCARALAVEVWRFRICKQEDAFDFETTSQDASSLLRLLDPTAQIAVAQ